MAGGCKAQVTLSPFQGGLSFRQTQQEKRPHEQANGHRRRQEGRQGHRQDLGKAIGPEAHPFHRLILKAALTVLEEAPGVGHRGDGKEERRQTQGGASGDKQHFGGANLAPHSRIKQIMGAVEAHPGQHQGNRKEKRPGEQAAAQVHPQSPPQGPHADLLADAA